MQMFNKRNALLGWAFLIVARRWLKRRVSAAGRGAGRRRGLLAGLGLAAGAATVVALLARRGHTEPTQPSA
jgi:hypothetical protein